MSKTCDYHKAEQPHAEIFDLLGRRLQPATRRLRTLALSCDGRVAFAPASLVTTLNPALVQTVIQTPHSGAPVERKPFDYSLLDSEVRLTKEIRPPVVGHEVVYQVTHAGEARKDTMQGRYDVAALAWANGEIFIVEGGGKCLMAVPRFGGVEGGTWGGMLGPWRVKELFTTNDRKDYSKSKLEGENGSVTPKLSSQGLTKRREVASGSDARKGDIGDGGADKSGSIKEHTANAVKESNPPKQTPEKDGKKRKRGFSLQELEDRSGRFPASRMTCVTVTHVFDSEGGVEIVRNTDSFPLKIVVAGKTDGCDLYKFQSWSEAEEMDEPMLRIECGFCATISCFEDVIQEGKSLTLVAIGGATRMLSVYGLSRKQGTAGESGLSNELLWNAGSSIPFGPINSLSWGLGTHHEGLLALAAGVGNSVTIVEWDPVSWAGAEGMSAWSRPIVHRIENAHSQLVSSVHLCADSSFFSSSLDGTVRRWRRTAHMSGGLADDVMPYSQVVDGGQQKEPVMSMTATVNGVGVMTLTTSHKNNSEVRDQDDDSKAKYGAGARKSLLSLYALPLEENAEVVSQIIMKRINALASMRRHVDEALSFWDLELYLRQVSDNECAIFGLLQSHCHRMIEDMKKKTIFSGADSICPHTPPEQLFRRYSRVTNAFAQLLRGVSGTDITAIERIEGACDSVQNAVRCGHYQACLTKFLQGDHDIDSASRDEILALEAMCQFISASNDELLWNASVARELVRNVRGLLEPLMSRGESLALTCAVCAPSATIPLVWVKQDANSFFCSAGDQFSRCVLTGLPCASTVPLMCYGCDARAVPRDFDPYCPEAYVEFRWVPDVGRCPLCLGQLLPSSVEIQ